MQRDDLPWNDPKEARDRFTASMQNDTKIAAMLMWDFLDESENAFGWKDWFTAAYEQQAETGQSDIWRDIQERIYAALLVRDLPVATFPSWDHDNFTFLVPFVSGGWMMGHYDMLNNTIDEEPGD